MPGEQTVRSVLETLIKGLCSTPGAASVSLQQQPGVQTIFLVAAADPVDTAFLQGGDLFGSLRIVTIALGQQQHSGLPCDFAVAQPRAVTRSVAMPAGAGAALGVAGPVTVEARPERRAEATKGKPAQARSAAKQPPPRRSAAAPKRRSKAKPSKRR